MPEFREFRRDLGFWPLAAKTGLVDYWLDTDQWPDFCFEPDLPFDCRQHAAADAYADPGAYGLVYCRSPTTSRPMPR